MNKIKEHILNDIKEGEIQKVSRLSFLAHDYFFWGLGALTVILGGLSVSVILHRIATYQIRPAFRELESVSVFIQTLPYLWLVAFLLLLFAAWFNVHKTSRAYKLRNITLVALVFSGSFLFGFALFISGFGQVFDEQSRERVPILREQFEKRERVRDAFIERRPGFRRGPRLNDRHDRPLRPRVEEV